MSQDLARPGAVLDACVLAGALRRNLLLSLAGADLFRPVWTERILAEVERAITRITRGEVDPVRQRLAMVVAFPDAAVRVPRDIDTATDKLPDPDDLHVLTAALASKASLIVTDNLRHFPAEALAPRGLRALSADHFIAGLIDVGPDRAIAALRRMRERLNRPHLDADGLIRKANSQELPLTARKLADHRDRL